MSAVVSSRETNESHSENDNLTLCSFRGYLQQMRKLARKSPIAHEILYYLVSTWVELQTLLCAVIQLYVRLLVLADQLLEEQ